MTQDEYRTQSIELLQYLSDDTYQNMFILEDILAENVKIKNQLKNVKVSNRILEDQMEDISKQMNYGMGFITCALVFVFAFKVFKGRIL